MMKQMSERERKGYFINVMYFGFSESASLLFKNNCTIIFQDEERKKAF